MRSVRVQCHAMLKHGACATHKDVALPWMTDARWEPGTLFLIFEEDFRFEPGHDVEPIPAEDEPAPLPGAYRPGEAAASGAAKAEAAPRGRRPRATGVYYEVPARAAREDFADVSRPLSDIVRYVTAAHRAGVGNVVWLSWQPGHAGERAPHPSRILFGSTLLSVSRTGAGTLRRAMDSGEVQREHFDLALKHWLWRHHARAGACYLWPPMGNYAEHPSGCDPQRFASARPSCWAEPWCCPGTRRGDDPQRREKWLCTWTAKGGCSWLRDVSNAAGNTDFDWRSWRTPGAAAAASAPRPSEPTAAAVAAEGHALRPGARRLRRPAGHAAQVFPDAEATEESEPDAAQPAAEAGLTKRRKRLLRQARAYWRLRNWVETEAEAASRGQPRSVQVQCMRCVPGTDCLLSAMNGTFSVLRRPPRPRLQKNASARRVTRTAAADSRGCAQAHGNAVQQ